MSRDINKANKQEFESFAHQNFLIGSLSKFSLPNIHAIHYIFSLICTELKNNLNIIIHDKLL